MEKKEPIKVFISLPISGQEKEAQIRANEMKEWLSENFGHFMKIITPFEICKNDLDKPYHYYMGKDIEKLLQCQIVIQAEGWEKSKGCQCEAATANIYGIKRIQYKDILEAYENDMEGIRLNVWTIDLKGIIRDSVYRYSDNDWDESLFTNSEYFFSRDAAEKAYQERIVKPSKEIGNELIRNNVAIAKSALLYRDANDIFAAEKAGLSYYNERLPIIEVKDAKGYTQKYQFIPMLMR